MTTSGPPPSALFASCYQQNPDNVDGVMLCITQSLEQKQTDFESNLASWLYVLAGAMVFFMQLGFAMLSAGCVRRKNVSNTLLKNLLDAAGAAVAFWFIGFAIAFGGQNPDLGITFVGNTNFFLIGLQDFGFWFYQFTCSAAAVTIIAGTLAERCRMSAYIGYSLYMTGWVYPVVAHSIWSANGFLSAFRTNPFLGSGCIDFAGGGVVHLVGGTTALVSAVILGPRHGRFYNNDGEPLTKPKAIPGHSVSLQLMGVLALWFGWYGFNGGGAIGHRSSTSQATAGSIAALTAVNTTLAGATGAISALVTYMYFHGNTGNGLVFDLTKTMNGALAGLVAITAGCGVVEPWAGAFIGMIAGWIYLAASSWLVKRRIDDAVDGIPVHLFGGAWGLLAVGLLASPTRVTDFFGPNARPGFFYSFGQGRIDASLLANEVLGILFIIGWVVALMVPFFYLLNYFDWLRSDTIEEIAGLDASYQVAKQEDHDELRKKIREEFRQHKKAKQESLNRSGHSGRSSQHSDIEEGSTAPSSNSALPGKKHENQLTSVQEADDEAH